MQIGIGLPATIPDIAPSLNVDWAKRADAGPFSSLSIIDRIVYVNYEPLMTLAAAAGATSRVRLMTSVLLAPMRDATLLAKQAATLDALSGGRLSLGLSVGGREDDFLATGTSFHDRGHRFDQQLATMRRLWSGRRFSADVGAIGPAPVRPDGPELLIGGFAPAALRRVGRFGDGYVATGADPASARHLFDAVEEAWNAEGRTGRPRLVMGRYFALGPDAARGGNAIRHYYAFAGDVTEAIVASILTGPAAIQEAIDGYAAVGVDELLLWPTIPDLDQVDLLAALIAE
jgi:alkanesulfonate monooxygenase SsuD/methylene tetrahydromethanopterin reductase-like flavin-dependent oxidoreductase (luciferase family)